MASSREIYSELVNIVGTGNVSDDEIILYSYSEDSSPFPSKKPAVVVRVGDTGEVSQILKFANKTKTPVVPTGGRSSISGAPLPRVPGAIMLDLTKMDLVKEVDDDTLTVTTQCGMRWAQLIHELYLKGYKLGFRGPYGGNAGTIGGSLSVNTVGCGASKWGGACNSVVSIEVVLPTGEVVRTGSAWSPVAKRFSRYATFNDLTGLFLGDHGTLGVKTEATLKIYPLPKGTAYADYGFSRLSDCVSAFHELQKLGIPEEIIMLGDKASIGLLAETYLESFPEVECVFAVAIEEIDSAISDRKKALCDEVAKKHGGKALGSFLTRAHWLDMFNMTQPLFDSGFWFNTCHIRPISTLPEIIDDALRLFKREKVNEKGMKWIISALGVDRCYSTAWITLFEGDPAKRSELEKVWNQLKEMELESGGVPYWAGPLWEPHVLPRVGQGFYSVLKKIKSVIDPNSILHPSTFGL
ncbi:MAG: FAD-binding oxidoreductase [Promethearchaeati archaeon SRVP18_Atabeyarchaeia-1]